MKRYLLLVLLAITVLLFGAWQEKKLKQVVKPAVVTPTAPAVTDQKTVDTTPIAEVKPAAPVETTPETISRTTPFTTQAPKITWDSFHEEMCEEASLLVAAAWFRGDTRSSIPVDEAEAALIDLSVWEKAHLGTDVSTTVAETARVATEKLQIPSDKVKIVTLHSVDDLKKEVAKGVVIAPFAGRLLGNPHFTGEGPRYHMSVIIGYDRKNFTVHDVGTRYGAYYQYPQMKLWEALHDFVPEPANISTGAKTVIVLVR